MTTGGNAQPDAIESADVLTALAWSNATGHGAHEPYLLRAEVAKIIERAQAAAYGQGCADERARVIATLRKYTSHVSTCAIRYRAECSCGLFDALNEPHAMATERDEGQA